MVPNQLAQPDVGQAAQPLQRLPRGGGLRGLVPGQRQRVRDLGILGQVQPLLAGTGRGLVGGAPVQAATNAELVQHLLADIHHCGGVDRLEQAFDGAVQGHDLPRRRRRLG